MGEDGRVVYRLVIDDSGAVAQAEAGGKKAGGAFEQIMVGAARRIGEAFVNMAAQAVKGVEQIARAGIEFNAKIEQYETAFKTLLGTEEEAARVMAQIREDAARTPFDVDSLTSANQMLISAGISADTARKDILNLANAIAATGGGSAELSRMAANLQQIQNTGKATAMDIRQFANAGINIYGLLADAMGVTTEQAAEMDVTYEQLTAALANAAEEGGKYAGALEAQSQTFTGRISTLKDNATQLAGALTEDLFTILSENALPQVMEWVAVLLEAAQTGGIEGALAAAGEILNGLITSFLDSLPQMLDTGLVLLEGLLDGITGALPKVIDIASVLLVTLVTALINHAPQLLLAAINLVNTLVTSLRNQRGYLIDSAITLVTTLLTGLIEHAPELLMAGIELIFSLMEGILTSTPDLLAVVPKLFTALVDAFSGVDWASIGANIVNGVWAGIVGLWDWLVSSFFDAVTNLWTSAKQALGIASPSKKMKWIGEMTVLGAEVGIEDEEANLIRTVTDVYSSVPDAAQSALQTHELALPMPDPVLDTEALEQSVSVNMTATGSMPDMMIVVPLTLDGREIARATAWSMGEQLAWEEI